MSIVTNTFRSTYYKDYSEAVYDGLKLSTYFKYTAECKTNSYDILDHVNGFTVAVIPNWVDQMNYVCDATSTSASNWFNYCSLMTIDAYEYIGTRLTQFVDFNDVWSSFMYNMLDKSIYLYSSATKM